MNITVVGTGYVGLANALALTKVAEVTTIDIDTQKVNLINKGLSPIDEPAIIAALAEQKHTASPLCATTSTASYPSAEYIFIATPTNYDTDRNFFDTSSVETVLAEIAMSGSKAIVVIRSTIPVGFTKNMQQRHPELQITFAPEFLREGVALEDALAPSRIVVGGDKKSAIKVKELLLSTVEQKKTPTLLTGSSEAEAIKLFANTYLAMRVAYFNELDTYAETHGMDSSEIVTGVSLDPRVGNFYNNPSFGYGGYCLPKDSKQLLANYNDIPNDLIQATVQANTTRKAHIVQSILATQAKKIGIYRLTMKTNSDNFRDSAILDIIKGLKRAGADIYLYEPHLNESSWNGIPLIADLADFADSVELIVANRVSSDLAPYANKVYSRDIFHNN